MFVLSYFQSDCEAMFLAVSADGVTFEAVRGGEPVVESRVGSRRIRDPFIGADADGRFHLVATDGWHSRSIVHAVSEDLLAWSDPVLIPVMDAVAGAHNAWAPEFFTAADGRMHLLWSSTVDACVPADWDWSEKTQDHRIWTCSTTDFEAFTPAHVFFDPGYPVIDATVAAQPDGFLLAFKDERDAEDAATGKRVRVSTFDRPGGPFSAPGGPVSGDACEGPALYRRGDEWVMLLDHYGSGSYSAVASSDGRGWSAADVVLPAGVRHGSVLTTELPAALVAELRQDRIAQTVASSATV